MEYLVKMDGTKVRRRIHARICCDCTERLCHKIEDFLDVEEVDYCGNAIQWKASENHD